MGLGLIGGADRIDAASVGYVLFFLAAAPATASWPPPTPGGTPHGKGLAILGVIGTSAVLGLLLLAIPALLAGFGLLPGP